MDTKKALRQLGNLKRSSRSMRLAAEGWQAPWQILIAILMSARTRDEVTIAVGEKLFSHYPTILSLSRARLSAIENLIRPVNFFRTKARSIKGCAQTLCKIFRGRPPLDVSSLVKLPGVGRKTANVFLSAMGKSAIGVDTHVAYISRTLGWTLHKDPRLIENDLEKLFPRRYWRNLNTTCVHFGKTHTSKRAKDEALSRIQKI